MDEVLKKLEEQLSLQEWPNVYFFKFIVPNTPEAIAKASALFGETAELSYQPSRTAKYMSVSAKEVMMDVQSILDVYKAAAKIEGVVSL